MNLSIEAVNHMDDVDGVLIIPFYNNNYVMSYNSKENAWQFPTGLKDDNESIKECIQRLSLKEIGGIIGFVDPIGYYKDKNTVEEYKYGIYIVDIEDFTTKPKWSETDVVKIFDRIPPELIEDMLIYNIILNSLKFIIKEQN